MEAMDRHPKLKDFFKVTALATDRDGGVYVANLEARDYPITATQWHPVCCCLRLANLACALCTQESWAPHSTSMWSRPSGCIFIACERLLLVLTAECPLLPVAAPVQVHKTVTCALSWAQEKNAFEFAAHLHIPHSPEAVSTSFAS